MNEVLFVIASQGFQQIEYAEPKRILEDMGFSVITASDKPDIAVAKDGSTTFVNTTIDKVNVNDYAGVFFIGGPGALEHLDNDKSYKILQQAAIQHKPIGAICISTRILAKSNVLDGKMATGWNEDGKLAEIFHEHNVQYLPEEKVVVDSNIITATGPSVAEEFGNRIVELLESKQNWG